MFWYQLSLPSTRVPWCYRCNWWNPKLTGIASLNPLSISDYGLWCFVWIVPCIQPLGIMNFCHWVNGKRTPTLGLKSFTVKRTWFSTVISIRYVRNSIEWGDGSRREPCSRTPPVSSTPELGTQEFCTRQLAARVFCRFSVWNPSTCYGQIVWYFFQCHLKAMYTCLKRVQPTLRAPNKSLNTFLTGD